jgi:hypothetical protein
MLAEKVKKVEEEGEAFKVRSRTGSILFMADTNPRSKSVILGMIDKELMDFVKEVEAW